MKKIIIGNWKLNGNTEKITILIKKIKKNILLEKNTIIFSPPTIYIDLVKKLIRNKKFFICAQNVDKNNSGSFTGETSPEMLVDMNVKYVLIGHSERRILHKERNSFISEKFFAAKKAGLIPVLCIGENYKERKKGIAEKIYKKQIDCILKKFGVFCFKNSIIAYEPIWAIGSGKSASYKEIQKTVKFIKEYISKFDKKVAKEINILYGGSVNYEKVIEYYDKTEINGVLLGKASLDPKEFSKISML
ncbi:triose-phosphate isomerase [bacterium endosymbiont of Pedicinus badii]|uniref:triose-phosphate isomerase n=1 Tax=bacterium endosymbiont of Pedicinus badii TaxID=1719126 RepID=UPI0009BBE186|nr:triose-phosphate isomerase [bacterium endosymbiont of Pedicinus badii]OQM34054.1 hypothetical protein AOQ89_01705 [bacterium endosymbiont of Pedicinus badii]